MRRSWVGLAASAAVTVLPSNTRAQWTVKSLHPGWAIRSYAYGIYAEQVVGMAEGTSAVLWSGTSGQCINLQPPASSWSWAFGVGGGQQVGVVEISNEWRASLWTGGPNTWVDLHPGGPIWASQAFGADGVQQVGYVKTGTRTLASLWSGSANSWVDLNPPGVQYGQAFAVNDGQQVGVVEVPSGQQHASLWTGTAASWIDMHPRAANGNSIALSVDRGQQVGYVVIDGQFRASLWRGTPESWIDLTPTGATESRAFGVSHGMQLGIAAFCGEFRPVIWYGTAESWEDLSLPLPVGYHTVEATSLWSDGVMIYVAGQAWNAMLSRHEAMLWTRPYGRRCRADLDFNGFVNGDDFDYFAERFESGQPLADFNHDCFVNGDDFDQFAEHFEAGC